MTELVLDICNTTRRIVPTLSDVRPEFIAHDYRSVLQYVLLCVCILRHVLPTLLILVLLCKLWDTYVRSCQDSTCSLPLPPGNSGLPFIGETLHMLLSHKAFFKKKRSQYGDVFRTHIFGSPSIRVVGAENVKRVLRAENTLVETMWPESTRTLIGEGSLSHARGEDHVLRKRCVMKLFTFDSLSSYVPVIQDLTQTFVKKWLSRGEILGYREFKLLNFDLSCRLLLGLELEEKECNRLLDVFGEFVANLFCLPIDVYGSGYRKGKNARETLLRKMDDVIQKWKSGEASKQASREALGLLYQFEKDGISEDEVKNTFIELLLAGHGTTSSAEAYLVHCLAKHKHVRQKIEDEMTSHGLLVEVSDETRLSFQKLNKLTYINNVVKEVLRLSPPVGGGFRKVIKTFEIEGYQIPAGWTLTYGIKETHDTNGYFDANDTFDPDRWNVSDVTDTRLKYLPFGAGRRACAGKDLARTILKIFILELVKNCNWELVNNDTKFVSFPVPHPADNLPLRLSRRI